MDKITKFNLGDKVSFVPAPKLKTVRIPDGYEHFFPNKAEWKKGIIIEVRPLYPGDKDQPYTIRTEYGDEVLKHDSTGLELDLDENDIMWWI